MGIKIWNTDISSIILWPSVQPTPRLPVEYQEVEYIESHWEEYIDTWVLCIYGNDYDLESDFFWADEDTDSHKITWSRRGLNIGFDDWDFFVDFGRMWASWTYTFTPSTYSYNTRFLLECNFNTGNVDAMSNLYIFCWPDSFMSAKLYSYSLMESSSLIRDFVPCYRKSDWEIWLYDLVDGVFYTNQWSWAFTKWPPLWCKSIKKVYRWSTLIWPSSWWWLLSYQDMVDLRE